MAYQFDLVMKYKHYAEIDTEPFKKIESVYKYASVELGRQRELLETVAGVEPEKIRKVK